jgi:hypothetical protein
MLRLEARWFEDLRGDRRSPHSSHVARFDLEPFRVSIARTEASSSTIARFDRVMPAMRRSIPPRAGVLDRRRARVTARHRDCSQLRARRASFAHRASAAMRDRIIPDANSSASVSTAWTLDKIWVALVTARSGIKCHAALDPAIHRELVASDPTTRPRRAAARGPHQDDLRATRAVLVW